MLRRRRFRTVVRETPDGGWTVSAEKGYLKETGNLLFHFALLAVLVGVGFGHWYGWHGNRILVGRRRPGLLQLAAAVRRLHARPPGGRRPTCRTSASS